MGVIKLYDADAYDKGNQSFKQKEFPIQVVKDFLFFFNLTLEDIDKFEKFSIELNKNRQFVRKHKNQFSSLTEKEIEIFKLVVKGKKSYEIAKELFIEKTTVSTHRKHIKQKLNLVSIFDWYNYAKAFNIL
ncbi:MAG: helix-turn-helix transcriptional regulator [Polaribacter sp.]